MERFHFRIILRRLKRLMRIERTCKLPAPDYSSVVDPTEFVHEQDKSSRPPIIYVNRRGELACHSMYFAGHVVGVVEYGMKAKQNLGLPADKTCIDFLISIPITDAE